MWEPRHLTTLWASMACYRDSLRFTLYCLYIHGRPVKVGGACSSETVVTTYQTGIYRFIESHRHWNYASALPLNFSAHGETWPVPNLRLSVTNDLSRIPSDARIKCSVPYRVRHHDKEFACHTSTQLNGVVSVLMCYHWSRSLNFCCELRNILFHSNWQI
jgi:hypothetical protein